MDTVMDSGGRVTRALRRRLTSIDSDNGSSRPGTPVQSKLATATTNSPLKPRTTRRNSISGPVKTPVKRAVNAVPPVNARSTRQRTGSLLENEETPKKEKIMSHFESLTEEEDSGPMTRSKSKSPEDPTFKPKTTVSQRSRKSMVQNQSGNSEQTLPKKEIDNEEVKCHEDLNNKENNIDVLNAARKKLHNVFANANIPKGNPKSLSNDFDDLRIESQHKHTSLAISFLKETEKVNLAEEVNVLPSMRNSLANDINAGLEMTFEIETEDHSNDAIESEKSYATCYTPLDSIIRKLPALSAGNGAEEEDVAGFVLKKDDYTCESPEKRQSLLTKYDDEVMSKCQDEVEMQVRTPKSEQKDIVPNEETASDTLTLNEENNEFTLRDNANDMNKETANINSENEISTNPDESPKSEQIDIAPSKEIGSGTLTLNEEHNEDINTASSPVNNNNSSECSLRDNADEPNKETVNINAENVISKNPDESPTSVSPTSPASSKAKSPKLNQATTPAGNGITDANRGRHSLKTVAFVSNNFDDECVKNSYPKTPASVKNKSFANNKTDDTSFQAQYSVNESIVSVLDTTDVVIAETQQEEITSTQCATKTIAEDDTVVSMAEDNTSNTGEKLEGNDRSIVEDNEEDNNDKLSDKSDAESEIQLKWFSPRVVANSCKLDTIGKGEETVSVVDECAHVEKKKPKKTFNRAKYNDDSDNEDDEEYDEFLDEEEEQYQEKKYMHVFIDEAMDVDDYESGDSMESEERREIIEHEILVDGESIGSHTTDEEESEDAECDNDSFIVSDENCDEENTVASTDSYNSEFNKNVQVPGDRKKKRDYNRIQRVLDTSSDEDDEKSKEHVSKRNEFSPTKGSDSEDKVRKAENPNKSNKISIQLQCATEDETNSSGDKETHDTSKGHSSTVHNISKTGELKTNANNSHNSSILSDTALQLQQSYSKDCEDLSVEDDINMSRKEILQKLNYSDRFNKSVRDINTDVDVSPDAVPIINTKNMDAEVEKPTSTSGFVCETDLDDRKSVNKESLLSTKHSESNLGEVSAISEAKSDQEDACPGGDSSEEVENVQDQEKAEAKKARALSVSIQKEKALQKKVLQQSFTIGVSVTDGELETEVIQNELTASKPVTVSSSPSTSLSSNEDTDGGVLSSDDARYLENVKHMPLGNPLVRTRRQSLALPTNPDMEIGPIQHGDKKLHKRKSLAVLLRNDFNPSQSFVDSVQLRKAELEQQTSKRKRLSKSFGGTTADISVVDIDVRHLHKRSKLSLENSIAESVGNTKKDNSMCLKASHSSTPHEKGSTKQLSNSGMGRILNRCDEILEAANRAKLEAKLNYRKSKIRLSKKNKKILQKLDKAVAPTSKEIRKRDKAKIAVTKALKASANIIMSQQRKIVPEPNRLPPVVLQSLADCQSVEKKNKKEKLKEFNFGCRNYCTAAGNVVEMVPTPKKKKKAEIIRLATGNVYVEPISPTRRSIISCNGMMFHESPMSPSAVGFTVCDAQSPNGNKGRKRKRIADGRKQAFPTPTWSQSGIFMEEEIPTARPPHFVSQARISKRAQRQANNNNFKQSAINRDDVKRSTAREILQLRERRQFRN